MSNLSSPIQQFEVRLSAAEFTSSNPILPIGYMGVETDTTKRKRGDGATAWSSLAYDTGQLRALGDLTAASALAAGDLVPILKVAVARVVRGTVAAAAITALSYVKINATVGIEGTAFARGASATASGTAIRTWINANKVIMGVASVVDNGNGTFDVTFPPGAAANSIVLQTDAPELTFAQTTAGADATLQAIGLTELRTAINV